MAEEADIVSYGFVKGMMSNRRNFNRLLDALKTAVPFDQAFASVYGGTPSQVGGGWVSRGGR